MLNFHTTFNQLLTFSHNLLKIVKISSFNLYMSSQMRASSVYHFKLPWEYFIFQQDSALTNKAATLFGFWSRYNITVHITRSNSPKLTQWTTASVESLNGVSTSPVCSKCQWPDAASDRRLVWHRTMYHWQRNAHESASLFAARGGIFEQMLKQH